MFNINTATYEQSLDTLNKIAFYNNMNNRGEIIRLNYVNRSHF